MSHQIKNQKILITGGGGFIGSHLTEILALENEIILYDTDFQNNCIQYSELTHAGNVTRIQGDILDFNKLLTVIEDVNIVIHAAAVVGVRNVITQPRMTLEVNFIGTMNVLKASLKARRLDRILYFSTSEIFGRDAFRVSEDSLSSIGSNTNQRWCYAIGKVSGEHLVQSYHREFGTPTVIVRPFNVFGPKRIGEHAVKIFMMQALMGKNLIVLGDGSQIRSWCYIDDFIEAMLRCLVLPEAIGNSFNIGNPINTLTIHDLARKIIDICNSTSKIVFKKPDYTDIDLRVPDTSKARNILDFHPAVLMDEGLLHSKEWYASNLDQIPYDAFYDDFNGNGQKKQIKVDFPGKKQFDTAVLLAN